MNKNKINIISFNVPFPANYGGVIDVFYKIKALHESGFEIVLHCFSYGRARQAELEKYCTQVYYYKRRSGIQYLFSKLPYIVHTRKNKNLLEKLKSNTFPILFEGLHSCYYLDHPELKGRKKIVRMHNVEHEYYAELAKATKNIFKKLFFQLESLKLKKYQKIISSANSVLAISRNDYNYFLQEGVAVSLVSAFHPLKKVISESGKGKYFLYHGNLSVEENEKAVLFLINQVINKTTAKFVIAGKSPGKRIVKAIQEKSNIELIINPAESEMDSLIVNAHACVLPTFQASGLKLKLLLSLFKGKHVIVNSEMVKNTGLESLCELVNSESEFIQKINEIKDIEFTGNKISERKVVLKSFSSKNNGEALLKILKEL